MTKTPGHKWRSTGIDCRIDARFVPTVPLVSDSGSSGKHTDQTLLFRTGPATTKVRVHFSDGTSRTLDASPEQYALVVWTPPLRVTAVEAIDANGRTLSKLARLPLST